MTTTPSNIATQSTDSIYFSCRPVHAFKVNPDGSPALINECPLEEAQWIGVYRHNLDHAVTDENPSDWVFDIPVEPGDHERAMKIANGLVELLNGISAQDLPYAPNLHVFFE